MERFIKPRASKMFGHPVYLLYGPGPSIIFSGPYKEFFNSDFGIWIGRNHFSDECCRPIIMHKVLRALELRHHIVENLSSMRYELYMIQEIVVP